MGNKDEKSFFNCALFMSVCVNENQLEVSSFENNDTKNDTNDTKNNTKRTI